MQTRIVCLLIALFLPGCAKLPIRSSLESPPTVPSSAGNEGRWAVVRVANTDGSARELGKRMPESEKKSEAPQPRGYVSFGAGPLIAKGIRGTISSAGSKANVSVDERNRTGNLVYGYWLSDSFAVEVDLRRTFSAEVSATLPQGKITIKDSRGIRAEGVGLSLVGIHRLSQEWGLLGKVRLSYLNFSASRTVQGGGFSIASRESGRALLPAVGVGLQYEVNKVFFFRGQWEKELYHGSGKSFSLGAGIKF